jgi:rhodanese-related sulfurtransferase
MYRSKLALVGCALIAATFLTGCGGASHSPLQSPTTVEDITSTELQTLMEGSDPLVVVDVRTASEYDAGHIPGSLNIPLDQLPERLQELDPQTPVACVCAGGYRSIQAAQLLASAGFVRVMNVEDGIRHWSGDWEPECPSCG